MVKMKAKFIRDLVAIACVAPILLVMWIHDKTGIPVWLIIALIVAAVVYWLFRYKADVVRRTCAVEMNAVDSMSGIEFERYLEQLLTLQGYRVAQTQASGDLGVDLVATRNGERIAIQAKRYSGFVSRRAISDAVAGMQHYKCNVAMVITNSEFSPGAKALAHSTGCRLVDRSVLLSWMIQSKRDAAQKKLNEQNFIL